MSYITKAEKLLREIIKAAQREARQNNQECMSEPSGISILKAAHRVMV